MKITIDTKVDSPDDIRKIMQILGHFAGKDQRQRTYTNYNSNPYQNSYPEQSSNTNSYNDSTTIPSNHMPVGPNPNNQQDTSPDFSAFMGLMDQAQANNTPVKEAEERKEVPRVMMF
ncbi:MAG: hypothetical protein ABIG93_00010 [archaeon]